MEYFISIDTGGTFTDVVIWGDGIFERTKADTTPHDPTEGVLKGIEDGARKLGLKSRAELLRQTGLIRLSTTIASNTLLQKSGVKLGCLVTKGYEDTLYAEGGAESSVFESLIKRDMVIGIQGRADASGKVAEEIDEDQVRLAVTELLARQGRAIVASVLNSALNPTLEQGIRKVMLKSYPWHYLGSVRLTPATAVSSSLDNFLRTSTAILDTYVHDVMARFLYKAEDSLRDEGYIRPLLIVHNDGTTVRVAKTRAVYTYGSGPVSGVFALAYLGDLYQIPHLLGMDVGGTSTDLSLVSNGEVTKVEAGKIIGIPTSLPLVDVDSINAGGGSVVWVDDGTMMVGPHSAGSVPGPVCFGLGGTEPTVTDAWVCLGWVDPNYYLGGRKRLDPAKARHAIEELAKPLKLTTEAVASEAMKTLKNAISARAKEMMREKRTSPEEVSLLSYGGGGGLVCSDVADDLGIKRVYVPFFASVCSAFGCAITDVVHEHEQLLRVQLRDKSGAFISNFEAINNAVEVSKRRVLSEMRSEGFSPEQVTIIVRFLLRSGRPGFTAWASLPSPYLRSQDDMEAVWNEFRRLFRKAYPQKQALAGEMYLERLVARGTRPIPHAILPIRPPTGKTVDEAAKGEREVFMAGKRRKAKIYEQKLLPTGSEVGGPAIIEAEDTNTLVPPGKCYRVDEHHFGIIEEG